MTYTRDLAASLSFLSLLQWKQEQRALSMTTICEAKDILLSLVSLGASPEIASELGCIYHNLASRQSNGDDIEPAMASCLLAQEYQRMACQWSPENKQYRQLLSRHLAMHSQFLKQQGRMSEAAELSDERTRLSDDNPQMLRLIAIELKEVAEHAYSKRQFVNAEKYRRQSTELFERADDIQRIRTGFHATAQVRIQTDEAPP